MKTKHLLIIGLIGLLGIAAYKQITITEYKTPSGAVCFGDPKPFDCEFPDKLVVITAPSLITPTRTATATASATPTVTPTVTRTPLPVTNTATVTAQPPLLVNGDFEANWQTGWTRYDLWPELPNFNSERGDPRSRHGGAQSLRIYNEFRCWLAGVYQTVNVPQFSTVRFSVWGRTWAAQGFNFDLPSDLSVTDGVAVGIDNSGGVDPTSTGVVWSESSNTEVWRQVSVQTVALAPRVTVFVRVRLGVSGPNQCQWPLPVLMGFVDDAALVIVP